MDKVMDQPELAESLTMDRFLGGSWRQRSKRSTG